MVGRYPDDQFRELSLNDLISQLGHVFDDGRGNLRSDVRFGRDDSSARDFTAPTDAGPAESYRPVGAEKTFHMGGAISLCRGQQGTAEQLKVHVGSGGLSGDRGDGRDRSFEKNLIPGLDMLDLGNQLHLELVSARL